MKYSILRDNDDLSVYGIIAIPDYIEEHDVQEKIYEIREKYYYNEKYDGWYDGVHWFDYLKDVLEKECCLEILDLIPDTYY